MSTVEPGRLLRALLLAPALAACAGGPALDAPAPPASARPAPAPGSPAAFFAHVVSTIQQQNVDPVPADRLARGALRRLGRPEPGFRLRLIETALGASLTHGASPADQATLTVAWPPEPSPADVGHALEEAGGFVIGRLGVRPADVLDTLLHGLLDFDPRARYFDPTRYAALGQPDQWADVGIGLTALRDGTVRIAFVVEGSPAEAAGLGPGDHVLTIDGEATTGLGRMHFTALLSGRASSSVVLRVARPDWSEPRAIVLVRAVVPKPVVHRSLPPAGYLWIRELDERTPGQVRRAVEALGGPDLQALVVDLRGNQGGLLTAAIEVGELFLPAGRLVAYTDGRVRDQRMRFSARAAAPALEPRMAVVVDGDTAAGAELVAAALQDWKRATVVGARTTGDVRIQTLISLPHGGGVRLTTARWYTARGRNLEGQGIPVDVEVAGDEEALRFRGDPARDTALRRALELVAAPATH